MAAQASAIKNESNTPNAGYNQATARLAEMKEERRSWDPHYRELQEFFLTRRGRWITDSKTNRGSKMNQKMVDPTPRFAARTLGAGMHAGSTNPASAWFKLATPDPEMMEFPSVSRWLYSTENLMRDVYSRTNLYSALPTMYSECGVFGTTPMLMLEDPNRVIHFVPKTVGSYYLAKNAAGEVDTMYCEYSYTTRQIRDEFATGDGSSRGKNLPTCIQNELNAGRLGKYWNMLHVVEPRADASGSAANYDMPWRSAYYLLDQAGPPLRESGFEDNAIGAFLWETTEITDPYGSSCGMDALGCAKAMQVQQKAKAKAIDIHIQPPMVGDPSLRNQPSTLLSGDITYAGFTPNGSSPKFQPAYLLKPELQGILLDIEDIRELVHKAMYTDLFMAITMADPRNATVPEIDARKEEQILALGPVLENHFGMMRRVIDRTFYIMQRQGRLPPPPPELEGVDLKVEMVGALAQTFKAIQGNKLERFVGFVGSVAKAQADSGAQVTVWDKVDTDQLVDEHGMAIGVPPTVIRGDDDVTALREAQARQQQAAQLQAQAGELAGAAKDLSETPVNGSNALQEIANAAA